MKTPTHESTREEKIKFITEVISHADGDIFSFDFKDETGFTFNLQKHGLAELNHSTARTLDLALKEVIQYAKDHSPPKPMKFEEMTGREQMLFEDLGKIRAEKKRTDRQIARRLLWIGEWNQEGKVSDRFRDEYTELFENEKINL